MSQLRRGLPTFPKRLGARSQPGRQQRRPGWPAAHTTHYAHGLRARDGRACRRAGGTPVGGRPAGRAGAAGQLGLRCRQLPDGKLRCAHGLCRHGHVCGSYICRPAHGEPAPSWAAPGHDLSPHTQGVGVIHTSCARSLVFYRRTQSSDRFGRQLSTQGLLHRAAAGAGPALHGGTAGPCGHAAGRAWRPPEGPDSRPAEAQGTGHGGRHTPPRTPVPPRPLKSSGALASPFAHTHLPPAPSPPPHADQAELPGSTGLSHLRGPDAGGLAERLVKAGNHTLLTSVGASAVTGATAPAPSPAVDPAPWRPSRASRTSGHHLICPNLFGFF